MKAIVTGATGYIGSHLCNQLLHEGWNVTAFLLSIEDLGLLIPHKNLNVYQIPFSEFNLKKLIVKEDADVIYHLAAYIKVEHTVEDLKPFIEANITLGLRLLEAVRGTRIFFINTGTFWQYSDEKTCQPVAHDLYAATKSAFEQLLIYYNHSHDINALTLYLFDVYGEDDMRSKIMNYLQKSALNQTYLELSPGEQKMDLVHIDDICHAFIQAYYFLLQNEYGYYRFSVSSKTLISLQELVKEINVIVKTPLKVNFGGRPYRLNEIMNPQRNIETLPFWSCSVSLKEGLTRIFGGL